MPEFSLFSCSQGKLKHALPRLEGGHVDPGAAIGAGELGFEDLQLAETVGELRVLGLGGGIVNRLVEAAEDLLEGIVLTFAVSAGKIGVRARGFLEQ